MTNEMTADRVKFLDEKGHVREIIQEKEWEVETHLIYDGDNIVHYGKNKYYIGEIPGLTDFDKLPNKNYLHEEVELSAQEIQEIIEARQFFKVKNDGSFSERETLYPVRSPKIIRELIQGVVSNLQKDFEDRISDPSYNPEESWEEESDPPEDTSNEEIQEEI